MWNTAQTITFSYVVENVVLNKIIRVMLYILSEHSTQNTHDNASAKPPKSKFLEVAAVKKQFKYAQVIYLNY